MTKARTGAKLPDTEWLSRNVVTVRHRFPKMSTGRGCGKTTPSAPPLWVLLTSDVHWDNVRCDRGLFKEHLEEAKTRNALWVDNGDLMCLMQGKFDPRSDQSDLRKEHRGNDYLDRVTDTFAEWLEPYAHMAVAFGHGNHETNVINRHGCDMTERLCAELRAKCKAKVRTHGIFGAVQFRLYRSTASGTVNLFRHHGYGGGAPVTRGVIQTNRLAVQYPNADVFLTGHTHNEWVVPIPRVKLSRDGTWIKDEQLHVRVPGYYDGLGDGFEGWNSVKGHAVNSVGSAFLKIESMGKVFKYDIERLGR